LIHALSMNGIAITSLSLHPLAAAHPNRSFSFSFAAAAVPYCSVSVLLPFWKFTPY